MIRLSSVVMFSAGTLNGVGLAKGWGPELMVLGSVLFFAGSLWLSRIRSGRHA